MIKNLNDLVLEAKKDNKDAMMEIINIFMPLISKYSRKLLYDGADSDIIILIIKLIKCYPISNNENSIQDKDIIAYINISVKHEYIRLSKKFSQISRMEMELKDDIYLIQEHDNIENILLINELLDKLSNMQKIILKELFLIGCTQTDLAKRLNISRQAVNKNKSKALKKLKIYLMEDINGIETAKL
jgi:RNA polymerase sigma factor (sigma-70 family)